MNPKLRMYLQSIGLDPKSDEAHALEFLAGLTGDQKEIAQGLVAVALNTGDGDGAAGKGKADPPAKETPGKKAGAKPQAAAVDGGDADAAAETLERVQTEYRDLCGLAAKYRKDATWLQERIGKPLQAVKDELLEEYAAGHKPVHVSGGQDRNLASIGPAIVDAILMRGQRPLYTFDRYTGLADRGADGKPATREPSERYIQFRGRRILDVARMWLASAGVASLETMSDSEVASAALNPKVMASLGVPVQLAQSTDSFPYLLADSARKSLRAAYEEAPSTWQIWCGRTTAPDYKAKALVALSEVPNFVERQEGGEYRYYEMSEGREQITLREYVDGLIFTRRAMLSDDLGGLTSAPVKIAQAARRLENTVAYAVLNANAALGNDSVALFHTATHKNLAGTGAVISLTTLDAAHAAMAIQKGPKGAYLNIVPRFILVPHAIKATAGQYCDARAALYPGQAQYVNRYAGNLQVVADANLDGNSATAWFLAADPAVIDTIVLGFLEGELTPVLKSETVFETDDLKFASRHTVAAKAVDYRGLYCNPGA